MSIQLVELTNFEQMFLLACIAWVMKWGQKSAVLMTKIIHET